MSFARWELAPQAGGFKFAGNYSATAFTYIHRVMRRQRGWK